MYGLVDLLDFHIVPLGLHIEFTLLTNVTGSNRDINQLAFLIVDGVHTDFQIDIHLALRNDTQRTSQILIGVIAVEHLVEWSHVEQVHLREESITFITVKMANITHHFVGDNQPTLRRIERQANDRVLENLLIALGQLLFFFLMFALLSFINQHTDDTGRRRTAWCIFCNAVVTDIEIAGLLTSFTDAPTVAVFYLLRLALCHLSNSGKDLLHVIGMDMRSKLLGPHLRSRKQVASQPADYLTRNIVDNNIVVDDFQRLLHHFVGGGSRGNAIIDTTAHNTVLYQYGNQHKQHHCQQQIWP